MLFNSYAFLFVFLPSAIAACAVADRFPQWRCATLIALSLIFYSYWDVRFLPLMLASILGNWLLAKAFESTPNKLIIYAGITANLLLLGVFKYTNFLAGTFTAIGIPVRQFDIVLPLGISFFTFHHIMYLVDLGRGKAPIFSLEKYALYICFFPQALAGPLARWAEVMHQFGQQIFAPGWPKRCALAATFIVAGLAQKVLLADPIGKAIDQIYARALTGPVLDGSAWMAPAFAFQVFFDFSGYSDMAIGLALIFNVQLPINFNAPFRTTSIVQFWQRWHMTLARFLRDYVFTPLSRVAIGGGRHRITRMLVAILLTMALCGLWHGAGWNYIVWGTLQGVAIVFASIWPRYLPSPPPIIGWAATIGFFTLTSVFFRSGSLTATWNIYQGLLTEPRIASMQAVQAIAIGSIAAIALPSSDTLCRGMTSLPRRSVAAAMAILFVVAFVRLGGQANYEFVYFQF